MKEEDDPTHYGKDAEYYYGFSKQHKGDEEMYVFAGYGRATKARMAYSPKHDTATFLIITWEKYHG
jgi:hypothetical protein